MQAFWGWWWGEAHRQGLIIYVVSDERLRPTKRRNKRYFLIICPGISAKLLENQNICGIIHIKAGGLYDFTT